jgi:Zn-dependent protease with chaperone function
MLTSLFLLVLSMPWTSIYGSSEANKLLTQYPDKRLIKAAALLNPEERPTVPVRISEDPSVQFPRYTGVPDKQLPEAFTLPEKDTIWVNGRQKNILGNNVRLAGNIGHEQRHITGGDEIEARTREIEILRRLNEKRYADLISRHYGLK